MLVRSNHTIKKEYETISLDLHPKNKILIDTWEEVQKKYQEKIFKFKVRDRELSIQTDSTSLSVLLFQKYLYQNMSLGGFIKMAITRKCTW